MTLSDRLQTKLDSARAQRAFSAQPKPRAFSRLHAIGLGLGLLMGGGAFLHGAQTPSNTLPATPVVAAEPAADWRSKITEATPADLTQPSPVAVSAPAAKPVKCNPYASNGTYLPELCGDHDAFADRAARTARPPADPHEAFWAEQNRREAQKRADCRAGRIDRDTCDLLVWDWRTRQ